MTTPKRQVAPLIVPAGATFDEIDAQARDQDRQHLETEELTRLWAALANDPFWLGYFKFQFHFGCRNSEVALLTLTEVDLDGGRVVFRRLKKRPKTVRGGKIKYAGGTVTVRHALPPKLVAILRAARAVVPQENPWFFGSAVKAVGRARVERTASLRIDANGYRAVSRSTAQKRFDRAAEKAGIPAELCHTHILRHTRATLLFASGASEGHVQHLLDHSSPTTTRKYMHWAENMRKSAELTAMMRDE